MLPEGCIKRTTSTIPFGYELDENINKLIDKFPTPEEFYYEDVSVIDMPHYIHG